MVIPKHQSSASNMLARDSRRHPRPGRCEEAATKTTGAASAVDDSARHGRIPRHLPARSFTIDLKLEDMATPAHYLSLAGGKPLPKMMKVWRVQTKKYPDVDWGLVAPGARLRNFTDAEVISSGLNQKGSDMVAIGRQGNFLLWGFAASPGDMTLEAPSASSTPSATSGNSTDRTDRTEGRSHALPRNDHDERPLPEGHPRRGSLQANTPRGRAKQRRTRQETANLDLFVFKQEYPDEVRDRLGLDPGRYIEWVKQNYDWLMPCGENPEFVQVGVDEDVKSLGLSNHKIELLDRCVMMLERR